MEAVEMTEKYVTDLYRMAYMDDGDYPDTSDVIRYIDERRIACVCQGSSPSLMAAKIGGITIIHDGSRFFRAEGEGDVYKLLEKMAWPRACARRRMRWRKRKLKG
jgi:hypothetical protein